ncbi:hypothetical protein SISNIDRAFT_470976 [Sistotremastrum niveocremeum HHB9708]|uniref:Uncharacterized protein n=1 Tax=Sistotremastrum niveocremeum HHB9708 TaxID=1314777 RepID=A0A164N6S9_9AGAM|nr:hypothetical protein SISNIDRAFT_470976 [Sistotremastrum niveocremeum HHB9708]
MPFGNARGASRQSRGAFGGLRVKHRAVRVAPLRALLLARFALYWVSGMASSSHNHGNNDTGGGIGSITSPHRSARAQDRQQREDWMTPTANRVRRTPDRASEAPAPIPFMANPPPIPSHPLLSLPPMGNDPFVNAPATPPVTPVNTQFLNEIDVEHQNAIQQLNKLRAAAANAYNVPVAPLRPRGRPRGSGHGRIQPLHMVSYMLHSHNLKLLNCAGRRAGSGSGPRGLGLGLRREALLGSGLWLRREALSEL